MKTKNAYLNIRSIVIYFILLLVAIISYKGLQNTFFEQDEWQTLGSNIVNGWSGIVQHLTIFQIFFAEGRILARIFYNIFLRRPDQSLVPLFAFGLLSHALNAWLIFLLVKKLKAEKLASWVAAIFFAINSVPDQAIIWISAIITVSATTLLLTSILFYLDFLETGNIRKRNFSFIVGILSLFFKETGLLIFILYPLLYMFWNRRKKIKEALIIHRPLLIYGAALVAFRLLELVLAPKAAVGFVGNNEEFLFSYIYHILVYPITSFFQTFVPPGDVYTFATKVLHSEYSYLLSSPLSDLVAQTSVADVVSLVGTVILSGILGYMINFDRDKKSMLRIVLLGLSICILSYLPYAVLHKAFSYMSSRYYYVGAVGAALLLGYVISRLFEYLPKIGKIILVLAVALYFFHHIQAIQSDLHVQRVFAAERKAYLAQIKQLHPNLENKTVFYITSDKKFLGEITYPFQNGLGYILEVIYYNTGKIPKDFLSSNFLWDLGIEGYREEGQYGFGYFADLDAVGELVKKRIIKSDIVYGYRYKSSSQQMTDITKAVREELATFSAELK